VLTGKYNSGVPAGSRATVKGYEWLAERILEPANLAKARKLAPIAAELGCTMAQMSSWWSEETFSTVITGASCAAQVTENMRALTSSRSSPRRWRESTPSSATTRCDE
jgi:aryl-alcohol dehydrogenase-like predicted oxidoreductase